MKDHFLALERTATNLAEFWYVTAAVALLLLACFRYEVTTNKLSPLPTIRPAISLLVFPLLAVLLGSIFTDVDESQTLTVILMAAAATLFLANVVMAVVVLIRRKAKRALLGASLVAELWVCFCAAASSAVTISGFGRHWR